MTAGTRSARLAAPWALRSLRHLVAPVGMLGVAAVAAAGCSPSPVVVGNDADLLWWSDLETGDTSDWTSRGPSYGSLWISGNAQLVATSNGPARSGRYALQSTLTTAFGSPPAVGLAVRQGDLPEQAYYSGWFFVPAPADPVSYWLCFKFRSRTNPSDPTTVTEDWDLELVPGVGFGPTTLSLYSHGLNRPWRGVGPPPPVPLDRWFQIEVFYRSTPDPTGQLTVWQDGTMIFDLEGQPTAPTSYVEWSVGSAADVLSPPSASIYVDDVAISRRRLGPNFPPFWRP